MEKVFAIIKIPKRLFLGNLKMGSLKVWENFISSVEIITLENSNLIRKMGGECTNGQGNSLIYIRVSLSKVNEMGEVHSGGLMEVGMKGNLEMEYRAVMGFFIEKAGIFNMKAHGTMECLMVKVPNSLKTAKDTKDHSNKTNFTVMVYFSKKIQ